MREQMLAAAMRSLTIESRTIMRITEYLDTEAFIKATRILCACPKIITSACGSSGIAVKKFAHSLCCIERNGYFLSPAEAVHGGLGCVKHDDAVVLASRGGKTSELIPIAEAAKKKGAKLITITENKQAQLAQAADVVLKLEIEEESDPLNIMATSSFIAMAALFDAMLAAIMVKTDYRLEQFALIHPGGAVGKRLNK